MEGLDWEKIGQALGLLLAGVGAGFGVILGRKKSDGKPPPDRAPTPHEVKEAIAEFHRQLAGMREKLDDHDDDHRQMARQLDRIENRQQISGEVQSWRDRTIPPR